MSEESLASTLVEILPQRFQILSLLKDRPMTQKELSKHVESSQSTVHRAVTTFVELHILERRDDQYQLTDFGERVVYEYASYLDQLESLCDRQLVHMKVADSISFQSPIFEDAEIFFNQPYTLDAASHKNRRIIQNSTSVRSVLDGIASSYLVAHELLLENEYHETTIVVSEDVANALLNTYKTETKQLIQSDQFELFRATSQIPYTITIAETDIDSYAILMKHEKNTVTFNVRNNTPEAITWAEQRFTECLEGAEKITMSDIDTD
ncbi:MarR family transcriptional regulator [Halostagnicola sp. A-GB9-2]|uniref:helix-turn-helix transcriptional regulator n=1 Tax=Halostagnicola sp. A-GB9-2 TaxID=3048066 RepID=UPI0024C019F7|nr:MarR family transcriptional regulator [Halostagnicola sp. A-GB9-2]MDJ1433827.1 ArsR family transcriptional regulator [Halostagnicola sp. A-GB9-2]